MFVLNPYFFNFQRHAILITQQFSHWDVSCKSGNVLKWEHMRCTHELTNIDSEAYCSVTGTAQATM